MSKLIDQITEFGINPKVGISDKTDVLKKLLVEIYSEYLNLELEFDNKEYKEEPEFDYAEIRQNVKTNFPEFDWYSMVLDLNEMKPNVEIGTGDALDDLNDIIKDLLAVKWKMDNTSEMDALWKLDYSKKNI